MSSTMQVLSCWTGKQPWLANEVSNMFNNCPRSCNWWVTEQTMKPKLLSHSPKLMHFLCNIKLCWWCWHCDSKKIVLNKCENKSWAIHYPSFISKPSSWWQSWAAWEKSQCTHKEASFYFMVPFPARWEAKKEILLKAIYLELKK